MLQLVLIIDSREQYSHVAHSKVEGLARHVQLVMDRNIPVEVRGLQQGDALWIAKSRWAILAPTCLLCHGYLTVDTQALVISLLLVHGGGHL